MVVNRTFLLVLFSLMFMATLAYSKVFLFENGTVIFGDLTEETETHYRIKDRKKKSEKQYKKNTVKIIFESDEKYNEYINEKKQKDNALEELKKKEEELKKKEEELKNLSDEITKNKNVKKEEEKSDNIDYDNIGNYLVFYLIEKPELSTMNIRSAINTDLYFINIDALIYYFAKKMNQYYDKTKLKDLIIDAIKNPNDKNREVTTLITALGNLSKVTPLEINVPPGDYIAWVKNGSMVYYENFSLYSGSSKDIYIDNIAKKTITIESNPSGAYLYVNNTYIGTTPYNYSVKENSSYSLKFEKKWCNTTYYTLDTTNFSNLSGTYRYILNSNKKKKNITINSNPPGASLYVDGYSKGITPCNVEVYEGSEYSLKFEKYGYHTTSSTLSTDELSSIHSIYSYSMIEIDEAVRNLKITSFPLGAEVYLGGKYKGRTPLTIEVKGPQSISLRLSLDGYNDSTRTLSLTSKGNYKEYFELKIDESYSMEKVEHGQWGVTAWLPIPTQNKAFSDVFKFGLGTSYLVNFGYFIPVRGYWAMDFIFCISNNALWNDLPAYMNSGFIFMNNYTLGMSFTIPAWRFPIQIGLGFLKAGYMIEYFTPSQTITNLNTNWGAFFGFGCEGLLGIQLLVTKNFGFYLYYKIGLLASVNHLIGGQFYNMDGQTISFGIKF